MESVNRDANNPNAATQPVSIPNIEDTQLIRLPPRKTPEHVPPFIDVPHDIEQMAAEMGVLTPKQIQANKAMNDEVQRLNNNSAKLKAGITAIQTQELNTKFEERRRLAASVKDQSSSYFDRSKQETVPVRVQSKEPWYKRGLLKKLWW